MDKSQRHYARSKKSDSKSCKIHDSIYITYWKCQNYRDGKIGQWFPGTRNGGRGSWQRGMGKSWGMIKLFYILILGAVQLFAFVKNQRTLTKK